MNFNFYTKTRHFHDEFHIWDPGLFLVRKILPYLPTLGGAHGTPCGRRWFSPKITRFANIS